MLYSSDQRWYELYQGVPEFTGAKYGIQPLRAREEWGVTVLHNTGVDGLERRPTGLRNGRNSGFAAINLAVHLGAKRILLLGYDMSVSKKGQSHWFGEHPERIRSQSPYPSFIAAFDTIREPLQRLGVSVINCSRVSALDCFARISLAEALR